MTPTNINFPPKKYAVAVSLDKSSLTSLLYKKKKPSGTEVRRTPDIKLRFAGFIRFVGFNFGQIQKIRFAVVMVWSYSFGHVKLVK